MDPITAIVDRLVAVFGAEPTLGAGTVTDEYPEGNILDADLPLTVIQDGDATYEKINANTFRIRRAFTAEIFHTAVTNADRQGGNARRAARGLMVIVPSLIANNNRLAYNDSGLNSVVRAEMDADAGSGLAQWGNRVYAGTLFTVYVKYDQPI